MCDDTHEDHIETTYYSLVCETGNLHLGTTKIPNDLNVEAHAVSCVVKPLIREEENLEIVDQSNTIEVFEQVIPTTMAKVQCKDPVLSLVYQYVTN